MQHEIVGVWSTVGFFPNDPQDEVLVFLPNGRGFYELWWWHLSVYDTFEYRIEQDLLTISGDQSFQEGEAKKVQTMPSALSFSGKFRVLNQRAGSDYVDVLELEKPIDVRFPQTDKFGRKVGDRGITTYVVPSFGNRSPTNGSAA